MAPSVSPINVYTLHGFRSSFATWAESVDNGRRFAPTVIEAALAHEAR